MAGCPKSLVEIIKQQFPKNWVEMTDNVQLFKLSPDSEEYKVIKDEITKVFFNYDKELFFEIERYQNIHDLGRLLIREQCWDKDSEFPLHRVRRYALIYNCDMEVALRYNLHYNQRVSYFLCRRFRKYLRPFLSANVVLVVQVLTICPESDVIEPEMSLEYFIEYIVHVTRR